MAIPELQNVAGKMVLPKGVHFATLEEVETRFGTGSEKRVELMTKLKTAVVNFREAGISRIYLDGSFTTDKLEPNDIDGCWLPGIRWNRSKLDPVLLDMKNGRKAMKDKYGLDFFLAIAKELGSGKSFPEFFQTDRDGNPKGIIAVELDGA